MRFENELYLDFTNERYQWHEKISGPTLNEMNTREALH